MKLNVIFGVLNQLTKLPEFKLLDRIIPVHDKTLEAKEYYRLSLPLVDIVLDDLILHEVHLSIYKHVEPNNPMFGPSHFTAQFHNSQGKTFRLHLFLNQFDTLACLPTWELLQDNHHYINAESPENIEYLTHFIWQHGLPYLQELHKHQKNIEAQLCRDYEKIEKQTALLYVDFRKNKQDYLNGLMELTQLAKSLSEISSNTYWRRVGIYLRKTQNLISTASEPSIEQDEIDEQENIRDESNSSAKNQLFSKQAKGPSSDIEKIQQQMTKIGNLSDTIDKTEDNYIKAVLLVDLNDQLIELDFEKETLFTRAQVETLRRIDAKLIGHAKSLLEIALLKGDYDFVQTLSPFYDQINSNLLVIALMNNNATLLAFLTKNLAWPINSYPITIGQTYPNVVQYCFSKSINSNLLVDCFSVLIKQGANLMQPVGSKQLPLAHVLLSAKPRHPLYAALEQNKNLTFDNQHFFNYLINTLKNYLGSDCIQKEERLECETWIAHYQQLKRRADNKNLFLNMNNSTVLKECSDIAKKFFSTALVEALEQDEEITKEHNYLIKEIIELQKRTKEFNKLTGKKFSYQVGNGQNLKKELLKLNTNIDNSFSELKEPILGTLNNSRLLISYCMDLLDVQKTIFKTPSKRNKQLKQLDRRQNELVTKINGLSKTMPYELLKQYNEVEGKLKKLESLADNLKNLQAEMLNLQSILSQITNFSLPASLEASDASDTPDTELSNSLN